MLLYSDEHLVPGVLESDIVKRATSDVDEDATINPSMELKWLKVGVDRGSSLLAQDRWPDIFLEADRVPGGVAPHHSIFRAGFASL